MHVKKIVDYNYKLFSRIHFFAIVTASIEINLDANPVRGIEEGRRSCRLALYEARISWHEIAATRENLRCLIMDRGRVGSQDEHHGEKERKREQVHDVRWAVLQGRANEAPLATFHWNRSSVKRRRRVFRRAAHNLVQSRTLHFSRPHSVAMPVRMLQSYKSTIRNIFAKLPLNSLLLSREFINAKHLLQNIFILLSINLILTLLIIIKIFFFCIVKKKKIFF